MNIAPTLRDKKKHDGNGWSDDEGRQDDRDDDVFPNDNGRWNSDDPEAGGGVGGVGGEGDDLVKGGGAPAMRAAECQVMMLASAVFAASEGAALAAALSTFGGVIAWYSRISVLTYGKKSENAPCFLCDPQSPRATL
jgi:hypothetical protein